MDTVDWEAVRLADVGEVAESIKQRVMNNVLAPSRENKGASINCKSAALFQ